MKPAWPPSFEHRLTLGLAFLLTLVVMGFWLPPEMLWGLNHGRWLPWPIGFGAPVVGFLLALTPARQTVGRWLTLRLGPALLGRSLIAYLLVPACGAALFWLFRDRTHMLGDGQTLAVMVAGDNLYHGFDFMTYHLVARLHQMTSGQGEADVFGTTGALSCLAGAAYLAAAAWSARRLAQEPGPRILLYGLLVGGAVLQLFFGYVEVYAPLAVAMLVFVTSFVLYREGRSHLLTVAVSWSVGLFFHLNALFLAPLLLIAFLRPPAEEQLRWPRRLFTVAWPILTALGLAAGIYATSGYGYERFLADFGHIGQGDGILVSLTGPEGLLTWRHLKDTVNLLLLLAGVPLVLLLVHLGTGPAARRTGPALPGLLMGSIWLVVLMALVHLKLGAVRDWDLFAPHTPLLVVAGWYATVGGPPRGPLPDRLVGQVVAVALVLAIPWWALNANSSASSARLEAVAADLAPYPRGLLHEQFAYHHQAAANTDEAIRHYRKSGEVCPNHPRFHAIYGTYMLNLGQLTEAIAAYDRAVAADPAYVYGLKMGLLARVMHEDFAGALEPARHLARLNGQDAEAAAAHGMAAQQTGRPTEAIEAYLRGFERDPARLDLLERAAGLQLMERDYAAAETNFRQLLAAQPARYSAAVGLADALWQGYLVQPEGRPVETNRARLGEVVDLIDRVISAGGGQGQDAAGLIAWREQVHARLDNLGE